MTENQNKQKSFNNMLILLFLIAILATYILVFFSIFSSNLDMSYLLPIVLVFGVIDLVVVLTLSAGILDHFGLSCKEEALGLPAGSVRALIALSLIVIFAIMAVFMGGQLHSVPVTYGNGTYVTDVNGTVQFSQPTQWQRDFSLQTLTTVSTLVVAVAGFYFGSKAAENAGKKKKDTTTDTIITLTTNPKDFADVSNDGTLEIEVKTNPENEAVHWAVEGDAHNSLIHQSLDKFTYKPSKKPARTKEKVMLIFKPAKNTHIKEKIVVTVKEGEEKNETQDIADSGKSKTNENKTKKRRN
jgi:hypothetical protein